MVRTDQRVVALDTLDGRLRVEFLWQHDRFAHRILLDQVEVARSIESDASEEWPESPPVQQLSLEEIGGAETILGVGSAGRSHWSLSLEVEPVRDGSTSVCFELASRCRAQPEGLRSTYWASESIVFQPCEATRMEEQTFEPGWRKVSIRPFASLDAAPAESRTPMTHRWSYRVIVVK